MKSGFLDKLIDRLDKLDPESIQTQFLKLAQERGLLETIFQSIQEGVIAIDELGYITYANRAAENILGFELGSVRGRPVSRYFEEIDWDRILAFDAGEWAKLVSHEVEIAYPQHRYVSFYVVPLGRSTKERGAVVILRDVTHERAQEASILESERLNAVKLLAAGVAHEIGNPLNALNIHLQLLEREVGVLSEPGYVPDDDLVGELGELVRIARNEAARLDLIITQFLRAIRPAPPELASTRIENVLKDALTLLRQEIQDRSIEVELVCPHALPEVRVDENQIKQVFFNVIRNAFQAMPDGGELKVQLDADDRYVRIAFADTGQGIEPEDMGRIFEPYHTTKSGGSGLGLMIVQRIVQDHGGTIEIQSKVGQGTTLTVVLPLSERRMRLLRAPKQATVHAGECATAASEGVTGTPGVEETS